ncbi:TlpA family protein disulfide reductase [Sphingobacterium gobiense]|nr:hypothetical protein [Sphingobacterium gobiense]
MNNFYKGGRGLAFSQREGEVSFRKEKPPRLSKILTHPVGRKAVALPSATVREFVECSSTYPRHLFDTCSGAVREVFECCSGTTRRTPEEHPKDYRSCPEPVPKRTRSAPEGHPNSTRRNRLAFYRFLGILKAGIKYRCSKDVVPFTQRLRKIAEVPLMYRECTVSVREVYRKGTEDLLRSYWRSTTDLLNACTSGVDQQYSNRRGIVGVEATKNKSMPFVLALIWFSRRLFSLMALKNIRILCLGFLCFMLFNLSEAWAQSAESRTAEGQIEIKPLQVGHRVPDEFWTKEHLFLINGDTVRKTLEEHRGKILVLDFWFTGCTKCLVHQKEINYFKEKYPEDLAVIMVNSKRTRDDHEKLIRYIQGGVFRNLQLPNLISIIEDEYLDQMFSPAAYPNYFWINDQNIFQLQTFRNLLDQSYVAPFIDEKL